MPTDDFPSLTQIFLFLLSVLLIVIAIVFPILVVSALKKLLKELQEINRHIFYIRTSNTSSELLLKQIGANTMRLAKFLDRYDQPTDPPQ